MALPVGLGSGQCGHGYPMPRESWEHSGGGSDAKPFAESEGKQANSRTEGSWLSPLQGSSLIGLAQVPCSSMN